MSGNKKVIKKVIKANQLMNDESNRLISWCLSIIGGSVLLIVSSDYANPEGSIIYSYLLFPIGWVFLSLSIYYGQRITRIYIAGITIPDDNLADFERNGTQADKAFHKQMIFFRNGVFVFSLWLVLFLFWFVASKLCVYE